MSDIKAVLEIAEKIDKASEKYSQMSWTQYTVGYDFGLEAAYKEINDLYMDKKSFDTICEYKEKTTLSADDKRRVELIYNSFKDYHLSPELNELNLKIQNQTTKLSQILNTHRPKFEGKEISSVELSNILNNDPDENRRKAAYFSRNQVNKPLVDGGFIDLLNLRKEYAKLAGAKDFVDYSLKNQELDSKIFDSWRDETRAVKDRVNSERSKFANKYLGKDSINPWDGGYLSSKIAPLSQSKVEMGNFYNYLADFFEVFGFDIRKDNTTYDVFPRKNKSEWGYNFTIKNGVDSRILANVKDKFDEFGVLLHETGHATHFFRTDPEDILMNYGISGIIAEGLANLFGGYLYHEKFYSQFFKDKLKDAEAQFKDMKRFSEISHIRATTSILFDQDLYRENITNLDDIHNLLWKLESDLTGSTIRDQDPVWGFRIHHTTHPIYLHNYFMGDVTTAMLKSVFRKNSGLATEMDDPKRFGDFLLKDVIQPSGRYTYAELFKRISGEDFSLKWVTDKI